MIERIYLLCLIIIIKSEVWTITHGLGLGHETMVSAVCISIFLLTFSALLALCAGDFTGHRWISHTKSSDAGLWCLIFAVVGAGKQWRRWWFESPSRSLWRHHNDLSVLRHSILAPLLASIQTTTIRGKQLFFQISWTLIDQISAGTFHSDDSIIHHHRCTGFYSKILWLNTLRPRQDGRHFPDDIFKCVFLNENV